MTRQRGLALITAVLVVAMAAVAATAMVVSQQMSVRRTGQLLHGEQAEAYAMGAESWASVLLRRDAGDNQIDTLEEDWAQPLSPLLVEGGTLQGRITDEQGRFNLNNLVRGAEANAESVTQFKRLLLVLELDDELVNALLDWLDPDIDPRFPAGAEDDLYLRKELPYRAANGPMADVSELRLVEGFTREVVERLRPHVTALPGSTEINVNTATAAVLASLAEGMTLEDGERLVQDRAEDPFEDLEVFKAHSVLAGRELLPVGLSLRSSYFRLIGQVRIGDSELWLGSLLERAQNNSVQLLSRRRILPQQALQGYGDFR